MNGISRGAAGGFVKSVKSAEVCRWFCQISGISSGLQAFCQMNGISRDAAGGFVK
jgi:hypothetical protein